MCPFHLLKCISFDTPLFYKYTIINCVQIIVTQGVTGYIKGDNKMETEKNITSNITLSVVMPAYNEETHIKENLLETSRILSSFVHRYEIIAVNDGSTDSTGKLIEDAAAVDPHITAAGYEDNHGKGFAITTGIAAAKGRYIAFLDSDLELSPSLLKKFMKQMKAEDADIVIGSKLHPESKLDYPMPRRVMSYTYYIMLKLLFHLGIHDTQTGIKLFKAEVIKPIAENLSISGYAFDIEILVAAHKQGYVISEAPIVLNYSRDESANGRRIQIKDIWKVFTDTVAIKKKYN